MKKIIKESIGRDLVGASAYSSRSKVVHDILLKYPSPDKLSVALAQMAKDTTDQRVAKKCLELSEKCKTTDIQQYPGLVKDITGLSKFWSLAAKTIGIATAAAGTTYLVRSALQASDDPSVKNATSFGDKAKALMSKTGDVISQDYQNVKDSVGKFKDETIQTARNWLGKQAAQSEAGQQTAAKIKANEDALSQEKTERTAADEKQAKALENESNKRQENDKINFQAMNSRLKHVKADAASDRAAIRGEMGKGFSGAAEDRAALRRATETNAADIARNRSESDENNDVITNWLAQNTQKISDNSSGIAQNASDISANRDVLAKHAGDIAANRDVLAKHTSDIATNSANIDKYTPKPIIDWHRKHSESAPSYGETVHSLGGIRLR